MKRVVAVCLVLIVILCGCDLKFKEKIKPEERVEIVYPAELIGLYWQYKEGWAESLRVSSLKGNAYSIWWDDDDDSVHMVLRDSDLPFWKEHRANILDEWNQKFSECGDAFEIAISEDYRKVTIYCTPAIPAEDVTLYAKYAEFYAACTQVEQGVEDWFVQVTIYNLDISAIAYTCTSNDVFSFEW